MNTAPSVHWARAAHWAGKANKKSFLLPSPSLKGCQRAKSHLMEDGEAKHCTKWHWGCALKNKEEFVGRDRESGNIDRQGHQDQKHEKTQEDHGYCGWLCRSVLHKATCWRSGGRYTHRALFASHKPQLHLPIGRSILLPPIFFLVDS